MARSELENCILQFQCRMKVIAPLSSKANGEWDGIWIDPKMLIAGRKEEMKYMRKMGVF